MTARPEVSAWQAAYRTLDDSALLALLPVLDAAIERAKREVSLVQGGMELLEQSNEQIVGHLHEAMTWRERGIDIAEFVAQGEELLDSATRDAPMREQILNRSFAYLVDLASRRQWILDEELQRRGLLPRITDFPYPEPS